MGGRTTLPVVGYFVESSCGESVFLVVSCGGLPKVFSSSFLAGDWAKVFSSSFLAGDCRKYFPICVCLIGGEAGVGDVFSYFLEFTHALKTARATKYAMGSMATCARSTSPAAKASMARNTVSWKPNVTRRDM